MRHLILAILTFSTITLTAQWGGEGGVQLNSEESYGGYTMFENFNATYLINNCGEVVNTWQVTNTDLHTKLLPDGQLIYIQGNRVYVRDWDDTILEVIQPGDDDIILVYEVIELENKNLLCLAREIYDEEDFEEIGYEFSENESAGRIDAVVELERVTGEVVWRWNLSDHVIQERDSLLPNYGIVKDNPQLLDMDAVLEYDWTFQESFMINGMDYNSELDQIVLSIRKINEVAIIDHSTTTEEAAGSSGGNSGMGGDILYRWGNPQNYGYGDEDDHQSFFQHNPNWVHYGEHEGSIIYFNNGLSREGNFSEAYIINPTIENGVYQREEGKAFGPVSPAAIYSEQTTDVIEIFSGYTSGAKVLPNGNIFLTEGDDGILREFTPDGTLVWQYDIPNTGYIFRGVRYGSDYPGLIDQDLTPQEILEDPPSDYDCTIISSTADFEQTTLDIQVHTDHINIINTDRVAYTAQVITLNGQTLQTVESDLLHERVYHRITKPGLYVIQIRDQQSGDLIDTVKFIAK